MRRLTALSFLVIILFLNASQGYRILCVFPYEGRSHFVVTGAICKELARRGHQIDMISQFPSKKPIANYTDVIDLTGTRKAKVNNMSVDFREIFDTAPIRVMTSVYGGELCELMGEERMQQFFKNKSKGTAYDLVITEYLGSPCYLALGHYYNAQTAVIVTFLESPHVNHFMGNPQNYGFSAGLYYTPAELNTFSDRVWNFCTCYNRILQFNSYTSSHMDISRRHLGQDIPDGREAEKNVSLALVTGHFSIQGVRPTSQGVVDIGGLHIEADKTKITPELKEWLDSAEHGVVYFTLGSMLNIESMPKQTLLSIYASFAKISPIKVLMKSANALNLPPGLPSNVVTSPWIPQVPVLKHKNTRVFITHGGLMGFQEAIYYSVPMIGIPVFADQTKNMNIMASKNLGVVIDGLDFTEQSLDAALNAVLYDPKYRESVKKMSKLFRDRPMTAMDTAVYWIEYVIRNGPISLRSPYADTPWWKLYLIDVFAFLIACLVLGVYLIFISLRFLLTLLQGDVSREKKLK